MAVLTEAQIDTYVPGRGVRHWVRLNSLLKLLRSNYLTGTLTWNPASLADGAGETSSGITVTGAAFGDYVIVSAPYDLQGCIATACVSAADTVKIRLQNESGSTVDLAEGEWKVRVLKD